MGENAVQAAGQFLYRHRPRLRFPSDIERQFADDTWAARTGSHRVASLVCLATYLIFLPAVVQLFPELTYRSILIQIGIVAPLSIGHCIWLGRTRSNFIREGGGVLVALATVGGIVYVTLQAVSIYRSTFLVSVVLVILFINVVQAFRFRYALAGTLATVLSFYLTIVQTQSPVKVEIWATWLIVNVAIFSLIANFRMEREERISYLLRLLERRRNDGLGTQVEHLKTISASDSVTGVANRRSMEHFLARLWADPAGGEVQVGLVIFDVDRFKAYNDGFGHIAGDRCLYVIAQSTVEALRSNADLLCRYGGEEFVAILPGASEADTYGVAERMRHIVENAQIPHPNGMFVTISAGVVSRRVAEVSDWTFMIEEADHKLYAAKREGRNLVRL